MHLGLIPQPRAYDSTRRTNGVAHYFLHQPTPKLFNFLRPKIGQAQSSIWWHNHTCHQDLESCHWTQIMPIALSYDLHLNISLRLGPNHTQSIWIKYSCKELSNNIFQAYLWYATEKLWAGYQDVHKNLHLFTLWPINLFLLTQNLQNLNY